jgi:CRISPR-associated protein Csd1
MILQRLVQYYDRLADDPESPMSPMGFARESVSFAVLLDPDGGNPTLVDERDASGKKPVPRTLTLPNRGGRQGTALKPNFLWDNTGYVLGVDSKGKPERSRAAFEAFRNFHQEIAKSIDDDGLRAVVAFLSAWDPSLAAELPHLEDALDRNLVFRIRGRSQYVHDTAAVRSGWSAHVASQDAGEDALSGQSLVTGETGTLARLHPLISGVANAQTMGAAIASFNLEAFTSHGREQTYNAPVTVVDAFKYTTALNRLLENRSRRFQLGDATVVFWAGRHVPDEECLADFFADFPIPPEDTRRNEQVRTFLSSVREGVAAGEAVDPLDRTEFFVLGLSPNASRLSVRFWLDTTWGELKSRLAMHLADTALAGQRDGELPPVIRRFVAATGRAETDAKGHFKGYDADAASPLLAGAIARAVFTGGPYPQSLLIAMLNRIRADGQVRHERVAAIKGCLVRNSRFANQPKEIPVALNPDRTDPAYVTGRLFALLEKIQTDSAEGDLNKTIKDRYFSAASATPGLVFPRLLRLAQHHLGRMDVGQKVYYEKQLGEVVGKLCAFAPHLGLEDQGLFAIGYFHQRQDLFTKKSKPETVTKEGAPK